LDALWRIELDITSNPGRERQSVVVSSVGWTDYSKTTYPEIRDDEYLQTTFGNQYRDILNLGVPIVLAAGNNDNEPTIDALPQLMSDERTPFIVVGAADYDGSRRAGTQSGDQLTVYAPGGMCPLQTKKDFEKFDGSGTSIGTYNQSASQPVVIFREHTDMNR
jgi:hypothetical protein